MRKCLLSKPHECVCVSASKSIFVSCRVPRDMLLPCSLLADHLNLNASLEDAAAVSLIGWAWMIIMSGLAISLFC